jgi:hypothetical protein
LDYVIIDDLGRVHPTGRTRAFDERAPTEEQAVSEVLSDGISQADADLERRPEPEPQSEPGPEPPPMDPATRKVFSD